MLTKFQQIKNSVTGKSRELRTRTIIARKNAVSVGTVAAEPFPEFMSPLFDWVMIKIDQGRMLSGATRAYYIRYGVPWQGLFLCVWVKAQFSEDAKSRAGLDTIQSNR